MAGLGGSLFMILMLADVVTGQLRDGGGVDECEGRYRLRSFGGTYGDPRDGAFGWADLLGVACSGACHEAAVRWGGAVGADSGVPSGEAECAALCSREPRCAAWTHARSGDDDASCSLLAKLEGYPVLAPSWQHEGTQGAGDSVSSGPVDACSGESWVEPWDGLPLDEAQALEAAQTGCGLRGLAYGESSAGACSDAAVVGVLGPTDALQLGVTAGWWNATLTEVVDTDERAPDVRDCAMRCNATSSCAAFTFGPLLTGGALCVLRGPLNCRPSYGWRSSVVSGPNGSMCSPSSAQATWLALREGTSSNAGTGEEAGGAAIDEGEIEDAGSESEGEEVEEEGKEELMMDPFFMDALAEPFFRECELPRCRELHMRGALVADGTFVPADPAACAFHFASPPEMLAGMAGRWQLLAGGSNAALLMRAWANALTPGLLRPFVNGTSLDSTSMALADVVWDATGSVVWALRGASWAELGVDEPENEMTWSMQAALTRAMERAPAAPGGFRLTLVLARFWQPVGGTLEAAHAVNGPWRTAPKGLISMVSVWYVICGVWWKDWPACRGMGLVGKAAEETKRRFADDLQSFLDGPAIHYCPISANSYGCYLGTHTYSNADMELALAASLRRHLADAPVSVRLFPLDDLSLAIPSEMVGSHLSNVLSLWAIQIFLNSVVDDFPSAPACPVAVRFTRGCHQQTLENSWCKECQCAEYMAECSDASTSPCTDWECASDRPCSFTVASPSTLIRLTDRNGGHAYTDNSTSANASSSTHVDGVVSRDDAVVELLIATAEVAPPSSASSSSMPFASQMQTGREVIAYLQKDVDTPISCRRLWCCSNAAGWALALLAWAALIGVSYWAYMRRRGRAKPGRGSTCVRWHWNPEASTEGNLSSRAGGAMRSRRRAVPRVALGESIAGWSERLAEGRQATEVMAQRHWAMKSPPRRHTAEECLELNKESVISTAASVGVHKRRHTTCYEYASPVKGAVHQQGPTSMDAIPVTIDFGRFPMPPITAETATDADVDANFVYTPTSVVEDTGEFASSAFQEPLRELRKREQEEVADVVEVVAPFHSTDRSYSTIDVAEEGGTTSLGSSSASAVEMGSCRSLVSSGYSFSSAASSGADDRAAPTIKEEDGGGTVEIETRANEAGGFPLLLWTSLRDSFPAASVTGLQLLQGVRTSFAAVTRSDDDVMTGGSDARHHFRGVRLRRPRGGMEVAKSTECLPPDSTLRQSAAASTSMTSTGDGMVTGGASAARALSRSVSAVADKCNNMGAALERRVANAVATGRSLGSALSMKNNEPTSQIDRNHSLKPSIRSTRNRLQEVIGSQRSPRQTCHKSYVLGDGNRDEVDKEGGRGQYEVPHASHPCAAKPAERIPALGFARMLASLHIVMGHLYAKGALRGTHMFGWGFTWVPWFFMLSGYVLTHARLGSADPSRTDPPLTFLWKRSSNIYPLYALGVALSAVLTMASRQPLPPRWILILQAFLLQAWSPHAVERCLQTQCWFLSAMVLYWLLFSRVYSLVRRASLTVCLALLTALSLLPWLFPLVPALHSLVEVDWYAAHRFGDTESPVDIAVTFLKYNPLCYAHVFLYGMLLARARSAALVDGGGALRRAALAATRFTTTAGYAGLLTVFAAVSPTNHKLSARTSILLPLQGMVLVGLASADDPLAAAFARMPAALGEASYAQYVLQFIVYDVWPLSSVSNPSFFAALLAASLLAVTCVQEPCRAAWMAVRRGWHVLSAPVGLAILLTVASVTYMPPSGELPAWKPVLTHQGTLVGVDVRLNLSAPVRTALQPSDMSFAVINPSLVIHRGRLTVAARAHAFSSQPAFETACDAPLPCAGRRVTQVTRVWNSNLLLATLPPPDGHNGGFFRGWDPSTWGLGWEAPLRLSPAGVVPSLTTPRAPWAELCQPTPTYLSENSTLVRKVVTGAEDPKLLPLPDGRLALTFNSLPPASHGACSPDGAVQQMYLSAVGGSGEGGAAVRIAGCGDSTRDEKNWIAFTWRSQLLYIYSLWPHRVLLVRPADGACVERWTTWYSPLERAARQHGAALHGSGTASLVAPSDGLPAYYVALLHFRNAAGKYSTLAYKFASEPPFQILSVSPPLPLSATERAFASGLLLTPDTDKAVITYGVDDAESRALVLDASFFLGDFFNGTGVDGPLTVPDDEAAS